MVILVWAVMNDHIRTFEYKVMVLLNSKVEHKGSVFDDLDIGNLSCSL